MIFKAWPFDRKVSHEINFHVPTTLSRMLSAAVEAGIEVAKTNPRTAMAPSVGVRRVFIAALRMLVSMPALNAARRPVKLRDSEIEKYVSEMPAVSTLTAVSPRWFRQTPLAAC